MEAQFRSHSFAVYVLYMLLHNFKLQPIDSGSVYEMKGAIWHFQTGRLSLENVTVIVWASDMAPGVSLSSPLSVKQIFWSVFLYTFVALTDLMGCRCGWLPLRFPLKELHIHVSRHVTTHLPSRPLQGGFWNSLQLKGPVCSIGACGHSIGVISMFFKMTWFSYHPSNLVWFMYSAIFFILYQKQNPTIPDQFYKMYIWIAVRQHQSGQNLILKSYMYHNNALIAVSDI